LQALKKTCAQAAYSSGRVPAARPNHALSAKNAGQFW
jgi:hypothetical protein